MLSLISILFKWSHIIKLKNKVFFEHGIINREKQLFDILWLLHIYVNFANHLNTQDTIYMCIAAPHQKKLLNKGHSLQMNTGKILTVENDNRYTLSWIMINFSIYFKPITTKDILKIVFLY